MAEVEVIKVEDSDKKSLPYEVVRQHHVDRSKYKTPHQSTREKTRRMHQYRDFKETWPVDMATSVHLGAAAYSW